MAPTTEEELKLRLFNGDMSHLGPAERFLKVLVDIPFAFKRLESLLFMSAVQEEVSSVKESFETLEVKQSTFLFNVSFPRVPNKFIIQLSLSSMWQTNRLNCFISS